MSAVEVEPARPRPLSGGLWTLFSWLRRDEHASNDSLSSGGSDRTAASFAFLPPGHYASSHPRVLPPPGPPTDSYKKRVRDRNVRRQHDRDITLLRKYGLHGFDAFSLPNRRACERSERDRRAASELLQVRAHVPGKRRAPPPPTPTSTFTRRRGRKRPAPQPPLPVHTIPEKVEEDKDDNRLNNTATLPMSSRSHPVTDHSPKHNEVTMGCKPEKYSKKEVKKETKDVKPRQDKSFLKQIFDNRKRNSAIETSTVKLLPSISELDKQAHEIIEKYKLKELEHNVYQEIRPNHDSPGPSRQIEAWICTRCLRKYDATVITCLYCLPLENALLNNSSKTSQHSSISTQTVSISQKSDLEDKEKLREILKEMKDSLPKKAMAGTSHLKTNNVNDRDVIQEPKTVEAVTTKIGSHRNTDAKNTPSTEPSPQVRKANLDKIIKIGDNDKEETLATIKNVLVTQPTVLEHTKDNIIIVDQQKVIIPNQSATRKAVNSNRNVTKTEIASKLLNGKKPGASVSSNTKPDMNTPLKVSSLLNPIYIPKNSEGAVSTTLQTQVNSSQKQDVNKNSEGAVSKTLQTQINSSQKQDGNKNSEGAVSTTLQTQINSSQKQDVNKNSEGAVSTTLQTQIKSSQKQDVNKNSEGAVSTTLQTQINSSQKQDVNVGFASNITPTQTNTSLALSSTSQTDTIITAPQDRSQIQKDNEHLQTSPAKDKIVIVKKIVEMSTPKILESFVQPTTSQSSSTEASIVEKLDQHSRRRNLINQLEQSIAKGDESAAAEAAVKLAQLRLSCSVLSFSSQIVAAARSSASSSPEKTIRATQPQSIIEHKTDPVVKDVDQTKNTTTGKHDENKAHESNVTNVVEKRENVSQTNAQLVTTVKPKAESALNQAPTTSKNTSMKKENNDDVPILVWVEDKETTRGPVQIHVKRNCRMGDLRRQAEKSLGLPVRMQRWIIGRALCSDDGVLLVALAGPELSAPFYLCLVEAEAKEPTTLADNDTGNVYNELVKLEQQSLVSNTEVFECGVCMDECAPGNGVVLRECVHSFCKECLSDVVRHSEEPIVSCPATGCRGVLQEREIKGLVRADDYEKWLARGLAVAESGTRNAFHCRTRDCTGWALCEPGVRRFPCPVCKSTNCVPCQAIHEGETCEQHRIKLQAASESEATNQADEGTRALLDSLIARGEALECPECSAIITKKWGCDWIKCSACKTEICWVTRGRRWGAAGRGDTSGGCRCGVDGKKCHPSCGYCH